jgi:hypothetical protein
MYRALDADKIIATIGECMGPARRDLPREAATAILLIP